jgi:hypothetical protein
LNNPHLDLKVALAPSCGKLSQSLVATLVCLGSILIDDMQQFEGAAIGACDENSPLPRPAGALGEVCSAKDVSHLTLGYNR